MRIRDLYIPEELPILPVRDTVLFPNMNLPLSIGRKKSLRILEFLAEKGGVLGIVAQKDSEVEDPGPQDLHQAGCIARIVKSSGLMEGSASILVQGLARMRIGSWVGSDPFLRARVTPHEEETEVKDVRVDAMLKQLRILVTKIIQMSPNIPNEAIYLVEKIPSPGYLADTVAHYLDLQLPEKQEVLEQFDLIERLKKVTAILTRELDVLELSQKIQGEVKEKIDKHQREYYLREQMKAIQKELGDNDGNEDLEKLKEAVETVGLTEEAKTVADKEIKRLQRMNPISPEYQVTRTYVEWLTELPWQKYTEDNLDLKNAARILDEDHYGLDKIKGRILEYLAVSKLKSDLKGPILCLQGPPGVGKTSLGKSIARALGRKFIRMSLGGVRDEAEIRGHRRTYVGALPGRIMQGMKKVKSKNPVFLLDEIDKLGQDFRGDPSSALLEALDPEQNDTFSDHYIEVAFDLSRVLFITTANVLDTIPIALRDRLEIITLPGYTLEEKMAIATRYLIPELKDDHGLIKRDKESKEVTEDKYIALPETTVRKVIHDYTWEAGVRSLKRELASVCRGVAKDVAMGHEELVTVDDATLQKLLGKPKFMHDVAERLARPGVVTGLSVTPAGGEILFVEAASMRGKGHLTLTGQLGDVMKESAQAALTFVKGQAKVLGIPEDAFEKYDLHVHVPAGAMPKDGPSAGVTMMTAIASLMAGRLVRADTAMTGEITLRGHVLPVGGIKEKVLAAHRADLRRVILPEKNRKDVDDIPTEIRDQMEFIFVAQMQDVFREALVDGFTPVVDAVPPAEPRLAAVPPPAPVAPDGLPANPGLIN